MSVSRMTAAAIHHNPDVRVDAGQGKCGKYAGYISVLTAKGDWRLLLSTPFDYESVEEAEKAMQDVVTEIKNGPDPFGPSLDSEK